MEIINLKIYCLIICKENVNRNLLSENVESFRKNYSY